MVLQIRMAIKQPDDDARPIHQDETTTKSLFFLTFYFCARFPFFKRQTVTWESSGHRGFRLAAVITRLYPFTFSDMLFLSSLYSIQNQTRNCMFATTIKPTALCQDYSANLTYIGPIWVHRFDGTYLYHPNLTTRSNKLKQQKRERERKSVNCFFSLLTAIILTLIM